VSGKPYTFTAADASVGLVREYSDWHARETTLAVAVMLAETELHVCKQLTELAVRLAEPQPAAPTSGDATWRLGDSR
jgi:hypothetical protein